MRGKEEVFGADSGEALIARYPSFIKEDIRSVSFLPGKMEHDNPILMRENPGYRGTILAMPQYERERLLDGNWNAKPTAGKIFNRLWFRSRLKAIPTDVVQWVRSWDKAGSESRGKFTAGCLIGKRQNGRTVIADMVRGQWSAFNREERIKQTADADRRTFGGLVTIVVEREGGSGGGE